MECRIKVKLRLAFILAGALALASCGREPVEGVRAEMLTREAELSDAIAANDKDLAPHVAIAEVRLKLGNGLGAETALRRAVELGADAARLRPLAARAVMLQGEYGRALALLEGGAVHPDAAGEAGHVAGLLQLQLGRLDAAREGFDQAIRAKPRDSALWVDVAQFRKANADMAGASDAADFAIELDDQNAEALAFKANLVRTQDGLAQSVEWFERALKLDPDNVTALLEYAATLGDLGQYRAMLSQVRHAAKLAPKSPVPYYLQAVVAARAGDFGLARSLLQRTNGKMDEEPGFLLLSAIVALELDGAAVAADLADRLLTQQPMNFTARRILAAASWASGDTDGAVEVLEPIIARPDADHWSLVLSARLAADQDQSDLASEYLARAARLARGEAVAFSEDDAFGQRQRAGDAEPLNPAAVIPAIRADMGRGLYPRAMERSRRLLEPNRGVADAQILFGDTALAAKQPRLAIRAFRDARAFDAGTRTALRLANAQHIAGDPAGAAATILALQRAQGASVVADRLSGHLAMDLRQWPVALDWFERVRVRLGNRDVVILQEMARAYAANGDSATADALAMAAVRLQPLNRDLLVLWADQRAALGRADDAAALRDRAKQL
jgi:cellulose synthase operon protein C